MRKRILARRAPLRRPLSHVRPMLGSAILAALSVLAGLFLTIPYPGGGHFSFGDAFLILGGLLLPWKEALLGAMLGGALLDLLGGSFFYLPWTVLAKGALALVAILARKLTGGRRWALPILMLPAPFLQAAIYLVPYRLLLEEGTIVLFLMDLVQGFGGLALAILAERPLRALRKD